MRIAFTLLLLALSFGPSAASASELEVTRYAPLKEMSLEAAEVRRDMEQALLTVSVGQARMKQAKEAAQEAASSQGISSNDYQVAQARYETVQRETMTRTLDQLERAQVRLDDASQHTSSHVQRMLTTRNTFESLVKGHLKNQRNPESTALILHMAVKKLQNRCQEMYAQALVGQLESDLSDIEDTLRLLGELGNGTGAGSSSLEEAWERFSGKTEGLSPSDDGAIDDLDRMLP